MKKRSVGVAILTLNAEFLLPNCLPPLMASSLRPRILVVDSSSSDKTVLIAREMGVETRVIPQNDFNHGLTREMARKLLNTDIVVMMTPDAIAMHHAVLNHLIEPILQGKAAVSYARQVAHNEACFFESFPRKFNYPEESQLRSIHDLETYGVYTFFCSDSCAAYCSHALDEIGGFKETLFGEDTIAAAELLRAGHKIAYQADAVVRHSHRYSLKQEFKRHFDIGIFRMKNDDLFSCSGSVNKRGAAYLSNMLTELWHTNRRLIYYAFLQTGVKWLGYQLGRRSSHAPIWWKKKFSSQPGYWTKCTYGK